MALKKITYNGSSKVIKRLCEVVNDLIDSGATDTWRNVKVNGTELLGTGTDTGALNLKSGTNVTVSGSGNDVTISATDTTYSDATQSASGLMSASDKTKLDGIASGAEVNVQSDWTEADNTSDAYIANKPNLAAVATSGAYSDLSGTPSLATVATSGSYTDLSNKPTIPTVNDATLTLTQGGSTLGTFTANASSNVTIDVPSGGSPSASSVSYDNTVSGLTATDVQDAIDEVVGDVNGKISDNPTFTEAVTRANIASGESFSTILGKIMKFFSDLKTVAFTGAYADLTGQPTIPTDFVSKASGGSFGGNVTVDRADGTISTDGTSAVTLGNNIASGTNKNSRGRVRFWGKGSYVTVVEAPNATANRNIDLPDASGTVALTSDIPTDFVPASTGGTFSGSVTVNKGSGSSYLYIGGASSNGNVNVYNNSGKSISIRYSDDATHTRTATFKDLNGQIVAASNFNNNFTANQTIDCQNGTTSALGYSRLYLGNNKGAGVDKNSMGVFCLYGQSGKQIEMYDGNNVSAYRSFFFPDKSGTFALTSDLPTVVHYDINSPNIAADAALSNSSFQLDIFSIAGKSIVHLALCVHYKTAQTIAAWGTKTLFDVMDLSHVTITYLSNGGRLTKATDGAYGGCIQISNGEIQIVTQAALSIPANTYYTGEFTVVV